MVEPYLYLKGKCCEAIDFYETVFGGKDKQVMRFKDMPSNPEFPVAEEMKELVVHGEITLADTRFSFSDTNEDVVPGNLISLTIRLSTPDEVTKVYNKLKDGGEILMELAPQFFSRMYGWVKDKYGVSWQLICM